MVDIKKEQGEINDAKNQWFHQTLAAEGFRTYNADDNNFDNIDEEKLGLPTATHIMNTFYGTGENDLPDAQLDHSAFVKACKQVIERSPKSLGYVNGKLKMVGLVNPDRFPHPQAVDAKCMCTIM